MSGDSCSSSKAAAAAAAAALSALRGEKVISDSLNSFIFLLMLGIGP